MQIAVSKKQIIIAIIIFVGIILRVLIMTLGHNYDFESYLIVGKIVKNGGNVYAETTRYNYGPIFLYIQGMFYIIASYFKHVEIIFRCLIVLLLTLTDIALALFILKKSNIAAMALFLLNPVTIIITGFHNQFDNIALLIALLSMNFYNDEERINDNDYKFVILLGISLIIKHLFFIMPVWIFFRKSLIIKKKIFYLAMPILLFILSFIPFLFNGGYIGILNNVFLYKSFNNAPLLMTIYQVLHIQKQFYMFVFIVIMLIMGWIVRGKDIDYVFLFYSLCLVAFSSAIANQYLVIPLVAMCLLSKYIKYIYTVIIGIFLLIDGNGLGMTHLINKLFGTDLISKLYFSDICYFSATYLIFIIIMKELNVFGGHLLKKSYNAGIDL